MLRKVSFLGMQFVLLLLFSVFFLVSPSEAKVLPQAKSLQGSGSTVKNVTVTGIGVFPRLRNDRRALIVNFTNLQNAAAVSYALTYETSSQNEGAMGSLSLGGASNSSNELLFGTCSKNVCRYHVGIHNAKLEVSYTTKSGKKYLKRYKIKV